MTSVKQFPDDKVDGFWAKRLADLKPIILPNNLFGTTDIKTGGVEKIKFSFLQEIETVQEILPQSDLLLAALLSYLSRLLNVYSYDIGYTNTSLQSSTESDETSVKYVPLHVDLGSEQVIEEFCTSMKKKLIQIKECINYICNDSSRHSDLRTTLEDFEKIVSVNVALVDHVEDLESDITQKVTFIIPKNATDIICFYDRAYINEGGISQLLHHFSIFLQGIISNPSLPLSKQPLLNEKERNQVLNEFNNTKTEYPENKVLQDLFEEQVEKTPNKIAASFKDKKLTFRELNERSNQLARKLRERDVSPDKTVGLLVDDNSIEMIIGMIGILKAGGAFLPLDLEYPKDRIEYMIKDSNVDILLSQNELKDRVSFKGEIINLENESFFTGECTNLESANKPNDLAYVIYTSGSTGKPKGVQVEHTSIVNQIVGLETLYRFDSSLNHILLASFSFDPAVQQIFLPLTSGGKLYLVPKSIRFNLKELLDFIVSNQIEIVNTVPSLMNALLDQIDGYDDLRFRYIILAGEIFSKNLYERLREILSAEKIINIYGPAEATINTTLYECELKEKGSTIPIGKPLMNYNVLILDEHQNLLPVGIPGEICISGVGLARGYINNPELTVEKFVANPFIPGERMYQTGDIGKWSVDGNLEFLGRIDHQVKIRGSRVELEEVEAALSQHPTVRESAVIDQEDHAGNKRLIAYVVPNLEQTLKIDELRRFLREILPDSMVPSLFVRLDGLPLTPNGKVDRRALPVPDKVRQEPAETFLPPRNELEHSLTKIWEKVLGIQPIGVKDDFFELGGDSLKAMVLFTQIEKIVGRKLPLATLYEAPTIEQFTSILSNKEWSAPWSPLVAIKPEGSNPPFFCVHGAGGNVLIYHDLARRLSQDQPFYGLQAKGLDGEQPTHTRIEDMAAHYIKEIQTVQPKGPYFLGGYCMGGTIALEMAQLLHAQDQKVALVALMDTCNWANLSDPSFLDNAYFYIQKIMFHLLNFLLLEFKGKLRFILEKDRTGVWYGMILSRLDDRFHKNNEQYFHTAQLWKTNVRITDKYVPKTYSGRMTLFEPAKQYARYDKPELSWEKLVTGGLDIYELPVYPAGMIVEPFVRILAEKLQECIDKALEV
jgi:aspartate racemase